MGKKFVFICVCIIIIHSIFIPVQAKGPIVFSVDFENQGEKFTYFVRVPEKAGIAAMTVEFSYDTDVFEYVGSEHGKILDVGIVQSNDKIAGKIVEAFITTSDLNSAGEILRADFTLKSNKSPTADSVKLIIKEVADSSGNLLECSVSYPNLAANATASENNDENNNPSSTTDDKNKTDGDEGSIPGQINDGSAEEKTENGALISSATEGNAGTDLILDNQQNPEKKNTLFVYLFGLIAVAVTAIIIIILRRCKK